MVDFIEYMNDKLLRDFTAEIDNNAPRDDDEYLSDIIWTRTNNHHFGCGIERARVSTDGKLVLINVPDIHCSDMTGAIYLAKLHAPDVDSIVIVAADHKLCPPYGYFKSKVADVDSVIDQDDGAWVGRDLSFMAPA